MNIWIPVRGENHEGATPIETPIKGYRNVHSALAVCRREEQKSRFGLTDYTATWKVEVEDGTRK